MQGGFKVTPIDTKAEKRRRGSSAARTELVDAEEGNFVRRNSGVPPGDFNDDETGGDSPSELEVGMLSLTGGGTSTINPARIKALEGQLKALIEKTKKLKQQNKELKDTYKTTEAERVRLVAQVEDLQQDNELILSQLQGQSEMLRNRTHGRTTNGDAAEALRRKRGDEMRKALLSDDVGDDEDENMRRKKRVNKRTIAYLVGRVNAFIDRRMPFLSDIKLIQARYGGSVSAYFSFYYWLIITYYWLGLASLAVCAYHLIRMVQRGLGMDYLLLTAGLLPQFMAFSSFEPDEGLMYSGLLIFFTAMLLGLALAKWVYEDRVAKSLDATDVELQNVKFAKKLLSVWDNGLTRSEDVQILQLSVGGDMVLLLEEKKVSSINKTRGRRELALLYLRRFIGFCIYISFQVASWAGIVVLTAKSATVSAMVTSSLTHQQTALASVASTIGSSLVPTVVSIINAIMPVIIQTITTFEKWDTTNMTIKQLVVRMYLAKMLNVLIQVLSYTVLADPYLLSNGWYARYRPSVAKPATLTSTGGPYVCRADQVGAGLFQIVLTEFIVSKMIALGTVWVFQLIARYQKVPYMRYEFDIATKTVSLLYFHALTLATLPWAPLTTIYVVIFFQLSFKFDKVFLFRYEAKPARPWKAQDAGGFFIKFYLLTFLMVGVLSVYYFLTNQRFPKSCSQQDDSIGLCASSVVNNACAISTSSPYFSWFAYLSKSDFGGTPCQSYPSCICKDEMACGPFTAEASAYSALKTFLYSISIVGDIYYQLTTNVLIVFALFVGGVLLAYFRQNTIRVQTSATIEREKEFESSIHTLEMKVRKQAKTIQKLEASSGLGARSPTSPISPTAYATSGGHHFWGNH